MVGGGEWSPAANRGVIQTTDILSSEVRRGIMRTFIALTIALLVFIAPVMAQNAADEAAIRSLLTAETFNEHDASAVADKYLEDSEYISSDSNVLVGRASIKEIYKSIFERNPDAKGKASVESLRFLKPDVAIALARGAVTERTEEPSTWKYLWMAVVVKKNGEWKIARSRIMQDTRE